MESDGLWFGKHSVTFLTGHTLGVVGLNVQYKIQKTNKQCDVMISIQIDISIVS